MTWQNDSERMPSGERKLLSNGTKDANHEKKKKKKHKKKDSKEIRRNVRVVSSWRNHGS